MCGRSLPELCSTSSFSCQKSTCICLTLFYTSLPKHIRICLTLFYTSLPKHIRIRLALFYTSLIEHISVHLPTFLCRTVLLHLPQSLCDTSYLNLFVAVSAASACLSIFAAPPAVLPQSLCSSSNCICLHTYPRLSVTIALI